jgi:hypothetical protein
VPPGEAEQHPGWRHLKDEALRDPDYAFRLTLALVREMAETCRRRGIGFLVATFPNGLGDGIRVEQSERFLASLKAEGVSVVDMGARFRARGMTYAAPDLDRASHLSPREHALTSEILEREIASRFGKPGSRAGSRGGSSTG